MNKNSKRWLGTLMIVALAVFVAVGPVPAGEKKKLPEGQANAVIAIEGMTCGGCCTKVEAAVAELKGVVGVEADYEKGTASVTYVVNEVKLDKIVSTINEKTSFKATAPKKKSA